MNTSTDLTPETRSRNIPHHLSGLSAVLAPMAGITIETRGVGRRGSATRSGIRANLAIMARFIIALMRCTAETPVPHNRAVVRDLPQPCCG